MHNRVSDEENKTSSVETYANVTISFDAKIDQLADIEKIYKKIKQEINQLVEIKIDTDTSKTKFFKSEYEHLLK